MARKRSWRTFVREHGALFLLLLFFGVLYSTSLTAYGMFVWDEAEYASLGRSVLRGEGFSISGRPNTFRPPLLPLSAAASMFLCNSSKDVIVRLPSLFFSLLLLFVVYWCVKTQFDRATGCVAAALLGLFPWFWQSTPLLLTEIPFMAFFTGAVLFFSFGLYRARYFFYWSWLCFGLALATRYNAVLLAPIIVVFLGLTLVLRDTEVWGRIWSKDFFLCPLLGLAIVAPWLVRQQMTSGGALAGFRSATSLIHRFLGARRPRPWDYYLVSIPDMVSWIPTVLVGVGIVWAVRKRDRFALHCLLAALTTIACFSILGYKGTRLVTSVLPFLAILAAVGFTKQLLPERLGKSRFYYGVIVGLLCVVFALNFPGVRKALTRSAFGYPSFFRALRFLREKTPPDAVIVGASIPQIYWYTERQVIDFPAQEQFPAALEKSEWVVVTNFERMQRRAAYAPELLKRVTGRDIREGNVVVFKDSRHTTTLIRSKLLKQRLDGEGQAP
jgi:4-amino-4-deoxy-L-arabinose transferase-like glycosyltransferase